MNGSGSPAGSQNAASTTPSHSARLISTVLRAPIRAASAPSSSAPPNARNCTIRMVTIRVDWPRSSSSVPNWLASAMTVWMPSL